MVVFEYVTAENGTVHLVRQSDPLHRRKTLCGRRARGWEMGDETVSGVAATCLACGDRSSTIIHEILEGTP